MRRRGRPGSWWIRGVAMLGPLALASFAAVFVAGCDAEPVKISSTTPASADLDRCTRLIDAIPEKVSDEQRRTVSPDDALGAAWGDPAIVLTCGGTWQVPAAANCQEVNGVDWYAPESQFADQDADVVLTTIGYSPVVRVEIPAQYRPPAAAMVDLAPAIKQTLDRTTPCT